MSMISVNNLTFSYDGSYTNIFENLILEYNPTMIFAEHDETFSDKIATKK